MSVIFPTEPSKVNLHLLPKNVEMITYRVSDDLTISAWMPDGFERVEQTQETTNDDFYHKNCEGCHRNCYEFLSNYEDEEGDIDWNDPGLRGHCSVYDDGYYGQSCPEGYEKEDYDVSFDVGNMVFQIRLTHLGELPRFQYVGDSAFLQGGKLDYSGELVGTTPYMASNVFGDSYNPENICWGYNPKPKNLREMVTFYFTTPFNNDLSPVDVFEENSKNVRYHVENDYYESTTIFSGEKYLCGTADAIMILDAEADIQAFYTMLMAGFKPLEKAPHVMLIPVVEHIFERNGGTYRGYKTVEDVVGKSWFISSTGEVEGLLVGQL